MPQSGRSVSIMVVCSPLMESFQDRFIRALQNKIPNSRCPLCQSSNWAVQPGIYWFKQHIKTGYTESWGDALPSAALVCNVCGNTQFVSVLAYGDSFKQDL
jgi:hypothetical protein